MFKSKTDNIELISIHIPKTAGCSFRTILDHVYGNNSVARVDIPLKSKLPRYDKPKIRLPVIDGNVRVIHGHFNFNDLQKKYSIRSDVPVITWLRDPVERVISNYFYLQKMIRGFIKGGGGNLNILHAMERSLLEYASIDISRNRISRFLENAELDNIYFIGIVEHYSEDLEHLSDMLGWKSYQEVRCNTSQEQRVPVSDGIREKIRMLNKDDVDLYNKALDLRQKRLASRLPLVDSDTQNR